MADNLMQIKRSANTAVPGILQEAEFAYSYVSNTLFIGGVGGAAVIPIAGGLFTGRLDVTPGQTTANKALVVDGNTHISSVRTSSFSIGASGAAATPITAIANTINASSNNSVLPTAKAVFDFFSGGVSVTTLNDLTDVGISSPVEAQLITFRSVDSQWFNVTPSGDITFAANGNFQIATGAIVDADINAAANIARGKIAAATQNHVVINGSDGRLSSEAFLSPSRGGTGVGSIPTLNQVLIGNGSGAYTPGSLIGTANRVTVTKTGSDLQFSLPNDVSVSTLTTSGAVTAGSLSVAGLASFSNDVTISGNLTVTGTLTSINSQNISVIDPLIELARNNNSDAIDIGLYGNYNDGAARFTGLFRDATDGKFRLFRNLTQAPTSTVMTEHASFQLATLVANIESANVNITGGSISNVSISGLTSAIPVASGGTGLTSLTPNAIIYAAGSTSYGMVSGTPGTVLQIGTSGVPEFDTLDGGIF